MSSNSPTSRPLVVLVGFLDTKYEEHSFISQNLVESGCDVRVIDVSIKDWKSKDSSLPIHHSPDKVCDAASTTLAHIRSIPRLDALTILAKGTSRVIQTEYSGSLCGIIGIGGSTSTALVCEVMRTLTIGLPKICVSTMASGDVKGYLEESDINLMPSIVDISGSLNDISRRILSNASSALAGMAHNYASTLVSSSSTSSSRQTKRVGITMFGLTTPGVNAIISVLAGYKDASSSENVYDPVVFHATGSGGKSMERLIDDGWFDAIIDLTTTELADELCGGVLTAGPNRLTAASRHNPPIPQIISLGALDMVNFGAPSTIPEHYTHSDAKRTFHEHTPEVTLMRTSREECVQLGEIVARKLTETSEEARRKTVVVVPLKGWSGLDVEGGKFWDPKADKALVDVLERGLKGSGVRLEQVDAHVNDDAFAKRMVEVLHEVCGSIGLS